MKEYRHISSCGNSQAEALEFLFEGMREAVKEGFIPVFSHTIVVHNDQWFASIIIGRK